MRRPGILSDADVETPEAIAAEVGVPVTDPKWMGLPASVVGVPTKWVVGAVAAFFVARAAGLL